MCLWGRPGATIYWGQGFKPTATAFRVLRNTVKTHRQVCWEKFTRYFEVEERFVPLEEGRYVMTADKAKELIDENTIGVAVILGSTYNGEFEDVKAFDAMLSTS